MGSDDDGRVSSFRPSLEQRRVSPVSTFELPEGADPRHTFLTARDIMARYGWGRTKCYEMLRRPDFPAAVGGDRYRLDTLMAWEDTQVAARPTPPASLPEFPARKRAPRRVATRAS
jgi:predicted DNA-binding transcriptional regulator AlpA